MPEEKNQKEVQDFKTLLASYSLTIPKEGDVVKCKIISIDKGEVHVDIEGLTVGVVRGQELFAESKEYMNLKVGDEVEATVLDLENENGEMELSFRIAGYQRAWNNVKKWMQDNITIKGKVLAANKGGLMMQVEGLAGFMPVSQLNPDHYPRVMGGDKNRILEKLRELMNKELEVKVIDVNEKEEKLIVSEKAVWEDAQKTVLESYKVGDTVEGEISALTSFGAFVKFGQDLEGLVHISEIAWQRIDHPKDILKVGDKVKAQIIQLDRSKIYLSIKRLVDDPWKTVKDKYKVGDKVEGKILKIEPFGLMVALDKDIHGLAHISELADEGITNISDKFKIGQTTDFEVVSLEPPEHRLGLRLFGVKGKAKKPEEKPADETKKPVVAKEDEKKAE
jgi:small subunit ribosomal protein S1